MAHVTVEQRNYTVIDVCSTVAACTMATITVLFNLVIFVFVVNPFNEQGLTTVKTAFMKPLKC